MKKLILGLAAVGALIALRPVARRKTREHCERMASKCKEMMASQPGQHEGAGMRERCQEMKAANTDPGETTETPEQPEQEAPQFAGNGEAVAV
jgi:hypothetical protein